MQHSPELQAELEAALAAKGRDYLPRTRHQRADGSPVYINRLIREDSPYLLQHAHNPVDWYAWGGEAFTAAREQNKPVFLSIGYSTCHWCHVMEEESFDNEQVAELLNEHFIAIKLDREQRPDIDNIYMTGVMLVSGQGGWPMSNFLTPGGEPFFAGTYYPPAQFTDLLQRVHRSWQKQQPDLEAQARRITEAIRMQGSARQSAQSIEAEAVTAAVRSLLSHHDPNLGGFSGAPKFPQESAHLLLLGQYERHGDAEVLNALQTNLAAMANGGIHDQVGGGFHRYAVDEHWLVPHFEEMLYNQAQLSRAYSQAWQLSGESEYARVARQVIDYVLRDMCSPEGAFYSATDADSEGEEGLFFVWTPAQLRDALPTELAELAIELYRVTEGGNFEGRSILHLPLPLKDFAEQKGLPLSDLYDKVDEIRRRLYEVRAQRIHPLRDDKLITAWNGMMITAIAEAALLLNSAEYRQAAVTAAEFFWQRAHRDDGRLWRVSLDGSTSVDGLQEDYACLAEACLALYDLTAGPHWLQRARELVAQMNTLFWDEVDGGYFMSLDEQEVPLPARFKESHDGATPSGNSVAARVLVRLFHRSGETDCRTKAEQILSAFSGQIRNSPISFTYMLTAADELMHGELGPLRYAGDGHVRVHVQQHGSDIQVKLDIAEGWHINAAEPGEENLVGTRLSAEGLENIRYPQGENGVYRGEQLIEAALAAEPDLQTLKLELQACSDGDGVCLTPETLTFRLVLLA